MRRIQIYDTTLRDGAQGEGISFSLPDKLALTHRLDDIGCDYVEGGYPASNEKDSQYFQRVGQLGLKRAKVCAFGMTRRKGGKAETDAGIKALLDSGAAVITLVGKASAFQVEDVLRAKLPENLEMIARERGISRPGRARSNLRRRAFLRRLEAEPRLRVEHRPRSGRSGARLIVLCDTNGGSMPEEAAEITAAAIAALPVPVGVHFHNDCDLAVANSLAGVEAGAVMVQGTINGFGERCGNADLISVIANLAVKKQSYDLLQPGGIERLTELSRYAYELVNMNFRANQPFVGKSAFAHKGGMHVSGIARTTKSYEHIDPLLVGNERRVLVSELSGRANIAAVAARHNIPSGSQLMDQILAKVVSMESAGYQFEAADASFDLLVRRSMNTFRPHFETLHYDVTIDNKAGGEVRAEAIVKVRVDGKVYLRGGRGARPGRCPQRRLAKGPQRQISRAEPPAPRGL